MAGRMDSSTARFRRHADRTQTMPCGRVVHGNGGPASHQNRCQECLAKKGAYLPDWVRRGIFLNMSGAEPVERLAAYAEWQRQEGDRLLTEMAASVTEAGE